tara:strand:+ start:188 stop:967 length:780 start_codon:yes stop_codon:yes gene_type:complete
MGVVDDDNDFKIASSMTPKHKKFSDDPEAVSIPREELEALKAQVAENKRRSLQNETRSIIAQDRSLENQKLLAGGDAPSSADAAPRPTPPDPKPKRGRPSKKDKEPTEPKEKKPKTQAQIAKEIKKVEADLKKNQKDYTRAMKFCKDQQEVKEQYEAWFTELGTKPDHKEYAPVFQRINFSIGTIFAMRDQLEAMPDWNDSEKGQAGHPLMDLQTYLLAVGNSMETTDIMECKNVHRVLKANRAELIKLQNTDDEFELK